MGAAGPDVAGVRPFAELTRGPVASVYKAYDADAGTVVLLKALRPAAAADPERRARFAEEARLAAKVVHPNVVRVLRVAPDGAALVAEWVEGRDLQDWLDARGALPPALVALVGREAARGMAAVHAAGIVHRDVTPANVLLGVDGSVRLTDFGLASLHQAGSADAAPVAGEVRGTLATMAPEVVRGGAPTPAADVFGLGALLAHALTGRAPFAAATPSATLDAVLHADVAEGLAADPRVPAPLAALVARALSRTAADRPTASALGDALDALLGPDADASALAAALDDPATPPPPLAPSPALTPRSRSAPSRPHGGAPAAARRRWRAPVAAVAGVAVAFVWLQPDASPPSPTPPAADASRPFALQTERARDATPPVAALETSPDTTALPAPSAPPVVPRTVSPTVPSAAPDAAPPVPDVPPPERARGVPTALAPPPADTRPATLLVRAEPWATVRIGGRDLGTTPVEVALPPGEHVVTFDHPGFPTHRQTVRLGPGATERAELSLWALVARVTLDVAPWAEVWVDGTLWDTVPPQSRPLVLAPGEHTLRFEHPALGRRQTTLRVSAGEQRTVRVRMTDPPS